MAITMQTTRTTAANNGKSKSAPAEFWINIGFWAEDDKTGEKFFVDIGGVPVSEPDANYSGNSSIVAARNEFLANLIAVGREGIEPGKDDAFESDLCMRLRHVAIGENAVKPVASVAKAVASIKLGRAA